MTSAVPALPDEGASADAPAKRLRVALLSFDFGETCVPLANALARSAEVCLVLPQRERDLCHVRLDDSIRFVPFDKPRLREPLRQVKLIRTLVREIRRFEPDVIDVHQGHLWFNLVLPHLHRLYPVVMTVHDPVAHAGDRGGAKTPQLIMNRGFRAADQLIVHAEALVEELAAVSGIDRSRIHAIARMGALPERGEGAGRGEEPNTVLFFGRIWSYKGLDKLILAEPLISQQVPSLRIIIAGHGEPFDRYEALMADRARFEVYNEYVSNELRTQLFERASVVVLPYVQASQSGVVPVAYSFGKPVVATNVGGLPEAVIDGATGLLVPPADVQALADAVTKLLLDDELRRRMGENGRRRFETTLSAEAIAARTLEICSLARDGREPASLRAGRQAS
jgi:glycosyltransferase involved in cell wall biosynthesis